ncbi:MAG TPA: flagellar filament capping protein FliD, partial [Chloroflexota bacterium]|nr:flagellar filament capping protein FliD [Chloroflexota bacterium]
GAILNGISAATGGTVTGSVVNDTIQLTSNNAQAIQLGSAGDTSNFLLVTNLAGMPSATTISSGDPVGVANPDAILNSANINGLTANHTGTLLVNGVAINYNTYTDSLNDVLSRINASSAGVTATYDANTDSVSFLSSKTGNIDVSVQDASGNLLSSLNMGTAQAHIIGTSAQYSVNGGPTQYSLNNTIDNVVPGVNVTFQAATPANQPLAVTIAHDPSVGEQAIQSFVTAYNAVVDTISQETAYDSTTKTAGIFLGDGTVDSIRSQLDSSLFIENGAQQGLNSAFADMTTIGLTTGAVGSQPGTTNDLQFDTSTFEQALSQNPAAVSKLVTTVFQNFSTMAQQLTQPFGVVDSAIQAQTTQISDIQNEIDNENQFLQQYQQTLNNEFTNLETTLAQLQSQSGAANSLLASASAASTASTGSTNSGSTPSSSSTTSSSTGSTAA